MKVAIINPFGNSAGHSNIYSTNICNCLNEIGLDIYLVTSNDFSNNQINLNHDKIIRVEVLNNTEFKKNYSNVFSLFIYGCNFIYGNFKVLYRLLKENRTHHFDAIHIIGGETITTILFFSLFRSKLPKNIILTIHNVDFDPSLYQGTSSIKKLYKYVVKFLIANGSINSFRKVMVHGEQMKNDFSLYFNESKNLKLYPINIGMEKLESIECVKKDNTLTILLFGIIRFDKGLDILLQSLNKFDFKLKLLIYGKPSELSVEEINNMIGKVDKNVIVETSLRYFDDSEIPEIFNNTDVVILPYRKSFKAQSVVLTLAASYKKTIICSNTGQNGFDVNKYNLGYTFEAENVEALNLILSDVASGHINLISEQRNFELYIEENSWSSMADKMNKMYIDSYE